LGPRFTGEYFEKKRNLIGRNSDLNLTCKNIPKSMQLQLYLTYLLALFLEMEKNQFKITANESTEMGERNGRDDRQIPPKLLVHTRIRENRVESADREEYFSHLYTTELTFSQVPKPMPLFNVQCQNSCVPIPTHFFEEKGTRLLFKNSYNCPKQLM
jgi:hypothetical protein